LSLILIIQLFNAPPVAASGSGSAGLINHFNLRAGLRLLCLTFAVIYVWPMFVIWQLIHLARARLLPAGITNLARPHTLQLLLIFF